VTSSLAKKIEAWRECLFRHGLEGEDAHARPKQVKTRHIPTRPRDPGNARPLKEDEQDSQICKAHFTCHDRNKVHRVPCHGDPEGEQKYSSALSSTSALDWGGPRLLYPRERDTVPILRRLGSSPGRCRRVRPTRIIISDPLVRNNSLHRLCYEGRLTTWGWAYVLQDNLFPFSCTDHYYKSIVFLSYSNLFLPNHCWCSGLLLHLITLNAHTHIWQDIHN